MYLTRLLSAIWLFAGSQMVQGVPRTPPDARLAEWKSGLHLGPRGQNVDLISQKDLKAAGEKRAEWTLQIEYSNLTFFDGSYTRVYVDHDQAFSEGLAFWTQDGIPGIQVDHWSEKNVGESRNSIRIHSKALFAGGLFLVDLKLMPWGCGVWPAIWMLGYDAEWPTAGEIDIVEGIQAMTNNQMTIHTAPGCVMNESSTLFSGEVTNHVCDSTSGGSGCSIVSPSAASYGMPFNAAGGGVFGVLWDGDGIRMWDWTRANVPREYVPVGNVAEGSITAGSPDPSAWGPPVAAWDASTCDPYTYFKAQQLVLNINLCELKTGDWAGNNYAQYSYCPGTCAEYVANPWNLNNTVMLINSIKVYQQPATTVIDTQVLEVNNQTGVGGPVARTASTGAFRMMFGQWAAAGVTAAVLYSLVI